MSIRRTLKGSDQYKGHLSVVLTNHLMSELRTSYLETMPWLLQFYLHSLRVVCNGVPRGKFRVNECRELMLIAA